MAVWFRGGQWDKRCAGVACIVGLFMVLNISTGLSETVYADVVQPVTTPEDQNTVVPSDTSVKPTSRQRLEVRKAKRLLKTTQAQPKNSMRGRRSTSQDVVYQGHVQGNILWQIKIEGPIKAPLVAVQDDVYVATTKGTLYAFDAGTGNVNWQKTLEQPLLRSSPVPGNHHVYVGTQSGQLLAFDRGSGQLSWQFQAQGPIVSSPVLATVKETLETKGSKETPWVFFTAQDGYVYGLDAETGTLKWQYQTPGILEASPLVLGDILYTGDYEGNVYALETNTGAVKWQGLIEGPLVATPFLEKDTLYFSSVVGALFALDKATGIKKWSYTSSNGSPMVATPTVVDHNVFVGDMGGMVGCVNNEFGIRIWQRVVEGAILSSLPSLKHLILVGTGNGEIQVLDTFKGDNQWKMSFGSTISATPALQQGGKQVFVGTQSGQVVAIQLTEIKETAK